MILLNSNIEDLKNTDDRLSVRAANACRSVGVSTMADLLSLDLEKLNALHNCGKKTLFELSILKKKYAYLAHTDEAESEPAQREAASAAPGNMFDELENKPAEEAVEKFHRLDIHMRHQLEDWVAARFDALNIRAKKAFPDYRNIDALLRVIYAPRPSAAKIKNVGRKTETDINRYVREVQEHFEAVTNGIDLNEPAPAHDPFETEAANIGRNYPFLQRDECENIIRFAQRTGHFPYLYVIRLYIQRSNSHHTSICRDYYGINENNRRHSKNEIAKTYQIGTERVRQIKDEGIDLPANLQGAVDKELAAGLAPVVSVEDALWERIASNNMLMSRQAFYLACALLNHYSLVQVSDAGAEYIVLKQLVKNIRLRTILSNICRIAGLRRTAPSSIDIMDFIAEDDPNLHPDAHLLCEIYANSLRAAYPYEIVDDRYVSLPPNALDIPKAIEEILESHGKPMSFDQLWKSFNERYPQHAFDTDTKFRAHIFRNKRIKAKGKAGIYVLDDWEGHYTGTITSFLEENLDSHGQPMPIETLVEKALNQFPTSNRKSVLSIIAADAQGRFVIYEGDLVGLRRNHHSGVSPATRQCAKRISFKERMDALREFVSREQRIPASNGTEEEQTLFRWMRNLLKDNGGTEQGLMLKDFLDRCSNLPQNGTEHKFLSMCNRVKDIINETHSLPSRRTHPKEYEWFKKYRETYRSVTDRRRKFFEDLLKFCARQDYSLFSSARDE